MSGLHDCAICHGVLDDKKLVNKCGHVFCKQCIEDYIKYCEIRPIYGQIMCCPVCREDLSRSTLKPPALEFELFYRMSKVIASSESVSKTIAASTSNINNLFVRTLTGKTINIRPKSGTKSTIAEVKELLENYEGIKPKEQLLVYSGKNLMIDKKLEDYNISEGSTIQLLVRLKGGVQHNR